MTKLSEIAINGLGLGMKLKDLDTMIKDARSAGNELHEAILLNVGMAFGDLESAERQQEQALQSVRTYAAYMADNPTVSSAESLAHYAKLVETHARSAQIAYSTLGAAWRTYQLATA